MKDIGLDLLATKIMGWKRRNAAWRPHEDIAHAFEVVEKLHQKNIWLRSLDYNPYMKKWTVCFYCVDRLPRLSVEAADTPAEAICLAALAAVEKEGE